MTVQPDIIIVGGGIAGLCCARTALEMGYSVLLFEKSSTLGGNLLLSRGIFNSYDPRRQSRLDITDSPEKHIHDILKYGHGKAHPNLVSVFCYEALNALNWLEHMGFSFEDQVSREIGTPHPRSHRPKNGGGLSYVEFLLSCLNYKSCTISLNTEVEGLEIQLDGTIKLLVKRNDETVRIQSKRGVVLCSGGFAANDDLRTANCPLLHNVKYIGSSLADGKVLNFAMDIGAETVHMSFFNCGFTEDHALKLKRPDKFILVNEKGERFCREDLIHSSLCESIFNQPYKEAWVVSSAEDGYSATVYFEQLNSTIDKEL